MVKNGMLARTLSMGCNMHLTCDPPQSESINMLLPTTDLKHVHMLPSIEIGVIVPGQ